MARVNKIHGMARSPPKLHPRVGRALQVSMPRWPVRSLPGPLSMYILTLPWAFHSLVLASHQVTQRRSGAVRDVEHTFRFKAYSSGHAGLSDKGVSLC
jgi:hypothetical protein